MWRRLACRASRYGVSLSIDMRYVGQGYEVRAPFPMRLLERGHIADMQRAFEAEYRRFYGKLADGVPVEAVNWRVLISGPTPRLDSVTVESPRTPSDEPMFCRPARFDADEPMRDTPVYRRERLRQGWSAAGPLIIEAAASTTVVLPGWRAETAEGACLLLTREDGR